MKKVFIVLTAICLSLSFSRDFQAEALKIERISGLDRYETALKTNRYINDRSSRTAVIVNGSDFRTALYGSYLASSLKIPYYPIPNKTIPSQVLSELTSRGIKSVYLVGGSSTLNEGIVSELRSKGISSKRLSSNISELAIEVDSEIMNKFYPGEPWGDIGYLMLINSDKFPDLLSGIPLLSNMSRDHRYLLSDYRNVDSMGSTSGFGLIIGGYDTIPSSFSTDLGDVPGINRYVIDGFNYYSGRIAGSDRYKTAVEVSKAYYVVFGKKSDTVILVDGRNFPDALSSGILANHTGATILLTQSNRLNPDTAKFIKDNKIQRVIIVGGENSVSNQVVRDLNS